jgi:hypothetical protein
LTVTTRFIVLEGELADAEIALSEAIHKMRQKMRIERSAAEMLSDIKEAMHATVPPHGMTVIQTLCHRERDKAFKLEFATGFPEVMSRGQKEIGVFLKDRDTPARKKRQFAANAFSSDPGKYRRLRREVGSAEEPNPNPSPEKLLSTAKGRPEKYDPDVIRAFARAIARAAGREKFERGNRYIPGPMFTTLLCAMQWALTVAWKFSAPPGTSPPPKLEHRHLEGIIRRPLIITTD